ncbi:hypothetical protein [Clostridium sp. AWRP]|uniref:hypothetical protein n=1 Tax=Clostridium sp. AWRP TaxID=2212991 RepID=UPI001FA993BD|nr:hypothetical protein [Clostridium sp. AWRP]
MIRIRFYVIDDDISIVRILIMIIEEDVNFEVVGSSCNSEDTFSDILLLKPDIVLVDLLMPEIDYINHKRKIGGKVSVNKFFEGLVLKC